MKKLVFVFAAIGLTTSVGAYATLPTSAAPFQLEIPNLKNGFELFVAGLYLQPTSSNLNYANVPSENFSGPGTQVALENNLFSNNPSFGWGFELGLGYVFANSGNDIQLSWTSYNHASDASVFTDPGQALSSGTGFDEFNYSGTYQVGPTTWNVVEDLNAGSNVDEKLNAIDLDVGQYVDIGTRMRMRFFAGLRGAQVEQGIQNLYHDMTDIAITNNAGELLTHFHYKDDLKEDFNSKFNGLGPLMGIKTSYHIWNCFGLTTLVDAAMLVGKMDTSTDRWRRFNLINNATNEPIFPEIFPININTQTSLEDQWRVVPAIDAKLGLNYTFIFKNRSTFTLEAGYQTSHYFDSVEKVNSLTGTSETNSVDYSGPYASLNYAI